MIALISAISLEPPALLPRWALNRDFVDIDREKRVTNFKSQDYKKFFSTIKLQDNMAESLFLRSTLDAHSGWVTSLVNIL